MWNADSITVPYKHCIINLYDWPISTIKIENEKDDTLGRYVFNDVRRLNRNDTITRTD